MTLLTHGSTVFNITQSGVATGNFKDGPAWMRIDSGTVTLTSMTPAASVSEGYAIHGAMLNPILFGPSSQQGFDEQMASQNGGTQGAMDAKYGAGVNAALSLPLTLKAGDVLLKAISRDFGGASQLSKDESRNGLFNQMNALYIIDWTPGAEEIAPNASGHSGRTLQRVQWSDTLDNIVASLPRRSLSGIPSHDPATLIAWLNYFDPGYGISNGATTGKGTGYQCLMVNNSDVTKASNYGRYKASMYHSAMWHLIGDRATDAQKKTLLIRMSSQGVQSTFPYMFGQVAFGGNGAHHQFHQCVGLLAMRYLTGHGLAPSLFKLYAQGNMFAQIFEFDASYIANNLIFHTDSSKPETYHEHTVASVTGVQFTTDSPRGSFQVGGSRLVRKSDGASSAIISQGNNKASMTLSAVLSPPLAIGDTVNFQRDPAPVPGDVDWDIRSQQRVSQFDQYNPSKNASYRSLQEATGVAVCVDLGAWDSQLDYASTYVAQSFETAHPTSTNDWPTHVYDLNGVAMNEQMWKTLWPQIQGGSPVTTPKTMFHIGGRAVLLGSAVAIRN
jgi:hypothetical protein